MEEKKRKRCPNFSEYEAEVVAVLALKYQAIIENKRTDGETLKKKEAVWSRIEEEFNEIEGVSHRSSKHLKTHYENLKRKNRRSSAADEKPTLSKTSEKIVSLIQASIRPNPSTLKVDPPLEEEETNLQVEAEVEVSCTNNVTDTSDVTRTSPSLSPTISMVSQPLMSSTNADADTETLVPSSASLRTEKEIIELPKKISPKDKIKCLSTAVLKPVKDVPECPKIMPHKNGIIDFCERRKDFLKMQAEMLQREHDMDMIIKDLKIKILKEKLKYWQRMNCSNEEE